MKSIRRGIAVLLAVLLMIPNMPATAREALSETSIVTEEKAETEASSEVKESSETEKSSEEELVAPSEEVSETEMSSDIPESSAAEETVSEETSKEEIESEESLPEETETEEEQSETEETNLSKTDTSDMVQYNTGNHVWNVVNAQDGEVENEIVSENVKYFDSDGNFTIKIPEMNPFFPYEVQFTYNGEVMNQWFMTPDDSVEIGGHVFRVSADFDNTVLTQMSLNVAGTCVIVYPEKKTFTDGSETQIQSLLPLEERNFDEIDLSAFTPIELRMVRISDLFLGDNKLKNTDKIMWAYGENGDNYKIIGPNDTIDLNYGSSYGGSYWQMIVGESDQLSTSNIRYTGKIRTAYCNQWLTPTVYKQSEDGKRAQVTVRSTYYGDYWPYQSVTINENEIDGDQVYVSFDINSEVFSSVKFSSVKVYKGSYRTETEASAGEEITSRIWKADMTVQNAGYMCLLGQNQWITFLCYDESGNVTGCLPVELRLYKHTSSNYVEVSAWNMCKITDGKYEYVEESDSNTKDNEGLPLCTIALYKEYPINDTYYLPMRYYKNGSLNYDAITAAYVGKYNTIAEATTTNATNIKDQLFGEGYPADYSNTVYFSIFVGEDGTENQEIYHYGIKTVTGSRYKNSPSLSSKTWVGFNGLKDASGNNIGAYSVSSDDDSYSEYSYLTMLVDSTVDLSNLAPEFTTDRTVKLYAPGSSVPEVSGQSYHDFSKGPVQYTAAAENGEASRNYWLQIVKAKPGDGWLYVNSLADVNANTRVENGITYSTREVLLDSWHDNIHDILFANMGTNPINELSVELDSESLKLDEYWTLKGVNSLSGFSGTQRIQEHGELANLAKIRLSKKANNVSALSGTLTIKSGATTLMVLNLTGTAGDPVITTTEIPEAVKYVPYGTMIQNSNKYSWNTVSYELYSGKLPGGMIIKPNGELYGVPTETGTFAFKLQMKNSAFTTTSTKEFTFKVKDNTNANVDASTDENYTVTQRIPDITVGKSGEDKLFVSQGIYTTFKYVFLDGEPLTEGVDFVSESGSTRITVKAETLDKLPKGRHTLGVEFREEDDSLKKAAQNFNVKGQGDGGTSTDNKNQTDGNGSQNGGNASEGTNASGTTNNAKTGTAANTNGTSTGGLPDASTNANAGEFLGNSDVTEVVQYTVVSGDTLWKIAKKFYGSGEYWHRIYEDNSDKISNPDRIYAGQILMIYLTNTQTVSNSTTNPNTNSTESPAGSVNDDLITDESGIPKYIVKPGDNLWKIAKTLYGRGWEWRKIFEANANIISSPNNLHAGQLLVIPK